MVLMLGGRLLCVCVCVRDTGNVCGVPASIALLFASVFN